MSRLFLIAFSAVSLLLVACDIYYVQNKTDSVVLSRAFRDDCASLEEDKLNSTQGWHLIADGIISVDGGRGAKCIVIAIGEERLRHPYEPRIHLEVHPSNLLQVGAPVSDDEPTAPALVLAFAVFSLVLLAGFVISVLVLAYLAARRMLKKARTR